MLSKFSQRWSLFFSVIFVMVGLVGCSFDTDDRSKDDTLEVSSGDTLGCVDEDITTLLDGGLALTTDSKVKAAFHCVDYVLQVIDSHINIKDNADIEKGKIKKLLQKKVANYSERTDEIIDIFFDLKEKTIKGEKNKISHDELKKFGGFLKDFRDIYLDLYPFAQFLSKSQDEQANSFRGLTERLHRAQKSVVRLFKKYNISISQNEMEVWLSSADILTSEASKNQWSLYWSFHELMWSKENSRFTVDNIVSWSTNMANFIGLGLKLKYSWTFQSYIDGTHTLEILSSSENILNSIGQALHDSENKQFSYESINQFLYYYEKVFGLPRGLTLQTLTSKIPIIVEKLINVPSRIRNTEKYLARVHGNSFKPYFNGFNQYHFKNLMDEFQMYKKTQLAIINSDVRPGIRLQKDGPGGQVAFINIVNEIPTYYSNEVNGLVIKSLDGDARFNWKNLSMLNIIRILTRAVGIGYNTGTKLTDIYQGIYTQELEKFIKEFGDLFTELHIMAVEKGTEASVVERMYIESKIFVASGDGFRKNTNPLNSSAYTMIRMTEAIEVVAHYASSLTLLPDVYQELLASCEDVTSGYEVFGLPAISRSCFNQNYLQLVIKRFKNLPYLTEYLQSYLDERKKVPQDKFSFEDSLIYAAKSFGGASESYITYRDYSVMGTLLLFIESVFLKFDSDKNYLIDKNEVDQSYPFFKELIEAKGYLYSLCTGVSYRHILTYQGRKIGRYGWNCAGDVASKRLRELSKKTVKKYKQTKKYLAKKKDQAKDKIVQGANKVKRGAKRLRDYVFGPSESENDEKVSSRKPKEKMPTESEKLVRNEGSDEPQEEEIEEERINDDNKATVDRHDVLEILAFFKKKSE